jgi:proton-translocating NADH-quinone oxidoreductase chain L
MSDILDVLLNLPAIVAITIWPLIGAILCAVFGGVKELRRWAHVPAVICAALSFTCVLFVVVRIVNSGNPVEFPAQDSQFAQGNEFKWFSVGHRETTINVPFELTADPIAAVMLLGITFIGFWIVVFSIGYMRGSPGFYRYFSVVSLFLASMTLLVLANNFILMFAGWEGVGLCSYLLVGFWHHKPSAADAARKAFLVTRLGDVGLILGIFLMWALAGQHSFEFSFIFPRASRALEVYPEIYTAACLLILCGAVGKSAQIPLYVWLPDAMEGPTPVSALIHAATMVTAGVYLLARCAPLFVLVPGVQLTVAIIGATTAIVAAFIALTQHDLKRVLAYSTVSQIGFMFLAVGCGGAAAPVVAVTAGLFHLFTHAFFKAVLFLSAGSVMHGMHDVIDMRQFGGLKRVMPITRWTFLAGALALAGVPVFAGFWSKDMILETALEAGHSARFGSIYMVLFGVAAVTALMTAFYTFRAYFRTFEGELRMPEGAHPHEPWVMSVPLIVLALGAVGVGFVHATPLTRWFGDFVAKAPGLVRANAGREVEEHANWGLMIGSAAVALGGVGLAYYFYRVRPATAEKAAATAGNVYFLSLNKLYVDELYNLLFVQPLNLLAGICKLVESILYDLVRLIASIPRYLAEVMRPLQNGLVQFYAITMAIGVAVFIGMMLFMNW